MLSSARRLLTLRRPAVHRVSVRCSAGIVDSVTVQMKEAMRAKDTVRLACLRNMRASFLNSMKETGADTLSDEKATETLRRLCKQRRDSIDQFRAAQREEMAVQEEQELALIESFLPALANAETTEAWVREAIAAVSASKPGDVGKVLGAVNKAHKGDVDNALAKDIAERLLKQS